LPRTSFARGDPSLRCAECQDTPSTRPVLGDELRTLVRTLKCLLFVPEGGCSTERESISMNSRIQELNCERAIPYYTALSDKLIQTLAVDDALTVRISVGAVIHARRLSVNGYQPGTRRLHAAAHS
jgi:hypothetical protein